MELHYNDKKYNTDIDHNYHPELHPNLNSPNQFNSLCINNSFTSYDNNQYRPYLEVSDINNTSVLRCMLDNTQAYIIAPNESNELNSLVRTINDTDIIEKQLINNNNHNDDINLENSNYILLNNSNNNLNYHTIANNSNNDYIITSNILPTSEYNYISSETCEIKPAVLNNGEQESEKQINENLNNQTDSFLCDNSNNKNNLNINSELEEYVDIYDVESINQIEFKHSTNFTNDEDNTKNTFKKRKKENYLMVADKFVPCRAWASLPNAYLYIGKSINNPSEYTVYSKKNIPLRTKFGPFEGLLKDVTDEEKLILCSQTNNFPLFVDGNKLLETSNENTSNWMRFVRFAEKYEQQNLLLFECNGRLYFKSCQFIRPKQELRVGFSKEYAEKYNFSILLPSYNDSTIIKAIEEVDDTNNNINKWICFECDKYFTTSNELNIHLSKEHISENIKKEKSDDKNNVCVQSNKIANTISEKTNKDNLCLKNDVEAQNDKKLIVEKDKNEVSVQKQQIPVESPSENKENNKKDVVNHIECKECKKKFSSNENLIKHLKLHVSDEHKHFECITCFKRFLSASALTNHSKIHLYNYRLFHCAICPEKIRHLPDFKQHVQTHTDDHGLYTCNVCNKKFKEYSFARKHIRTFHPLMKHSCCLCGAQLSEANKLRRHLLKHSNLREFLCSKCGKQFKRKDKLTSHIKKCHNNNNNNTTKLNKTTNLIKIKKNNKRQISKLNKNKEKNNDSIRNISESDNNIENENMEIDNNCNIEIVRNVEIDNIKNDSNIENNNNNANNNNNTNTNSNNDNNKQFRFSPKVSPNDYQRFIYKCHDCLLGFKRRGMLVNHLAKRHPNIKIDNVPELNLPILQAQRFYYCQYCDKVYKSSTKRKMHILKYHPGFDLPMSNRQKGGVPDCYPNPTYSQTIGSITTDPHRCKWCHKQYASKAKLLQHQRKQHTEHVKFSDLQQHNLLSNPIDDNMTFLSDENECQSSNNYNDSAYPLIKDNHNNQVELIDNDKMTNEQVYKLQKIINNDCCTLNNSSSDHDNILISDDLCNIVDNYHLFNNDNENAINDNNNNNNNEFNDHPDDIIINDEYLTTCTISLLEHQHPQQQMNHFDYPNNNAG